jgi:hypothetical protein
MRLKFSIAEKNGEGLFGFKVCLYFSQCFILFLVKFKNQIFLALRNRLDLLLDFEKFKELGSLQEPFF